MAKQKTIPELEAEKAENERKLSLQIPPHRRADSVLNGVAVPIQTAQDSGQSA